MDFLKNNLAPLRLKRTDQPSKYINSGQNLNLNTFVH